MNQIKRKFSNNESSDEEIKKLKNEERKSITCIEDFSNELFYEIFDYFDGFDVYKAFANLNTRFQDLLACTFLRLRISFPSIMELADFQNRYNTVIFPNKHRIISLYIFDLWINDTVFSLMTINSSFTHLESLVMWGIKPNNLLPLLLSLSTLSRLFSLTIYTPGDIEDFSDAYHAIFSLPALKYNKLSLVIDETFIPSSTNNNYQLSPLQYLIIDHSCTLPKLVAMLSCTPQLRHLYCELLDESNQFIDEDMKMILPNLTHISIDTCHVKFNTFERFIKTIGSQLQILRITTSDDTAYLNGDQWERLLVQYMPHLRIFKLNHQELVEDDFEFTTDHALIHRFTSSFWIKRQSIVELIIFIGIWGWHEITYSIHPYRKPWYELNEFMKNYSNPIQLSQSVVLTILNPFNIDRNIFSIEDFNLLFIELKITDLIIECQDIYIAALIELLNLLPNLDSLKVDSLSLLKPRCLLKEEVETFRLVSMKNNITKVNLVRIKELAEVQFLIDLCPRMQYIEVDCSNEIDIKLLVRFILMKTIRCISHLCTLCLSGKEVNDEMVKELQGMINLEQLLHHYTIMYIDEKIYIQLK